MVFDDALTKTLDRIKSAASEIKADDDHNLPGKRAALDAEMARAVLLALVSVAETTSSVKTALREVRDALKEASASSSKQTEELLRLSGKTVDLGNRLNKIYFGIAVIMVLQVVLGVLELVVKPS